MALGRVSMRVARLRRLSARVSHADPEPRSDMDALQPPPPAPSALARRGSSPRASSSLSRHHPAPPPPTPLTGSIAFSREKSLSHATFEPRESKVWSALEPHRADEAGGENARADGPPSPPIDRFGCRSTRGYTTKDARPPPPPRVRAQ